MNFKVNRRQFFGSAAVASAAIFCASESGADVQRKRGVKIKISLNCYSFNRPLRDGEMSLDNVIDFCAEHGFDAVDTTGYYFPGYPEIPSDSYIFHIKQKAFLNGLSISGTGIRNDFAQPDKVKRDQDIQLIKNWIVVAQKLGAPVIRIFSGNKIPDGYTWDQVADWMARDIRDCAAFGKEHGVMVAVQHHHDFLKTAQEIIRLVEMVDSDWFGVILDVGSLRTHDPYQEIKKLLPYAVSWQLKENVWFGEKEAPIDLQKIRTIIDKFGYRGFLPIETLGEGEPKEKIRNFLNRVRNAFS